MDKFLEYYALKNSSIKNVLFKGDELETDTVFIHLIYNNITYINVWNYRTNFKK